MKAKSSTTKKTNRTTGRPGSTGPKCLGPRQSCGAFNYGGTSAMGGWQKAGATTGLRGASWTAAGTAALDQTQWMRRSGSQSEASRTSLSLKSKAVLRPAVHGAAALLTALCFLGLLLFSPAAHSQPSSANSISFQGALTGVGGQPLANGNYNLTFKFYMNASTLTALATSSVPNVPVTGGLASTPVPVDAAWFNGQTRYLGIAINGGTELAPRVLVTAVPYAINAATLTGVAGKVYLVPAGGEVWNGPTNQTSLAFGNNPDLGYSGIQSYRLASNSFGALHLNSAGGDVVVGSPDQTALVFFNNPAQGYSGLQSYRQNRTAVGALRLQPGGGTVHIGSDNPGEPSSGLQVLGTTRTSVLQITGGADLAEHLSVNDGQPSDEFKVEPGMVVSIDPSGNRKFKLADEAYDHKRVGIISGGNGVKPGLILGDEGNAAVAGDQPIALTGQVWCHADATFGPIIPGDLLTTSGTPGHAMKVSDDAKARFAVLGQALTGLAEGRGWVQVLVGKQ